MINKLLMLLSLLLISLLISTCIAQNASSGGTTSQAGGSDDPSGLDATDPYNMDSDGDNVPDGVEAENGTDPYDATDYPSPAALGMLNDDTSLGDPNAPTAEETFDWQSLGTTALTTLASMGISKLTKICITPTVTTAPQNIAKSTDTTSLMGTDFASNAGTWNFGTVFFKRKGNSSGISFGTWGIVGTNLVLKSALSLGCIETYAMSIWVDCWDQAERTPTSCTDQNQITTPTKGYAVKFEIAGNDVQAETPIPTTVTGQRTTDTSVRCQVDGRDLRQLDAPDLFNDKCN